MKNDIVLRTTDLVKTFGTGHTAVHAVAGVSMTVRQGEIVLVMGPSGSGKTTLLSMLGTLLRPTSGTVAVGGVNITEVSERQLPYMRADKIGFIFQSFQLLDALSAEENVLFPARLRPGSLKAARVRARALLKRLGLESRMHAKPQALSGGEKQRVAIARALINEPPIILADEPTGNLDSSRGQEVMMILHDIARDEGRAIVVVTHDPRMEALADRVLWLEDGQLRDRKSERHDWVVDPVCGMRVDRWTAVHVLTTDRERVFCTERCLRRFEDDPSKYPAPAPPH